MNYIFNNPAPLDGFADLGGGRWVRASDVVSVQAADQNSSVPEWVNTIVVTRVATPGGAFSTFSALLPKTVMRRVFDCLDYYPADVEAQ